MLGPWETRGRTTCLSCAPRWSQIENATARMTTVLEKSAEPLYIWDIQRLTAEHRYARPALATVSQTLAERQYCWAGRSLYGLYRHGLLPGARDLGVVAAAILHTTNGYMRPAAIHFTMRAIGYRYAIGSINSALTRAYNEGLCVAYNDGTYSSLHQSEVSERRIARALGFHQRGPAFYAVAERLREQVAAASVEQVRRTS
jgi:hypothetical protein